MGHYELTPGAILDSANTWLADQSFGNGVAVTFGATSQETISNGDGATDLVPEVQVQGTAQADGSLMLLVANTTNTRLAAPTLALVKGGNAAIGTHTALADDEVVGNIIAYGDDGTDYESPVGSIQFVINGTPGTGDMPGSIEFYTTPDGGETLTLAATITHQQRLVLTENLHLTAGKRISFDAGVEQTYIEESSNDVMDIYVGGALMMRLTEASPTFSVSLENSTLLNVGAAGQDWTSGYLAHVGSGSGGEQKIRVDNSSTGEAIVQIWSSDGGADAYLEIGAQGTYVWRVGQDNDDGASNEDGFAICGNDALGSNDALRITATTPPVISFNATQGSDFDYACASCGRHGLTSFTCCGLVEWHDDVKDFRSMSRREEAAMDYMERVGVIQRSTKPSGESEIFTTFQMVNFVGSMAYQNRERMDTQYEELNHRLQAIGA